MAELEDESFCQTTFAIQIGLSLFSCQDIWTKVLKTATVEVLSAFYFAGAPLKLSIVFDKLLIYHLKCLWIVGGVLGWLEPF